jgi:hypothetical protein
MGINHPVNPAPTDSKTWNTDELQRDFAVTGFMAGMVFVTRKSDGVDGTLQFNGNPRVYHSFQPS